MSQVAASFSRTIKGFIRERVVLFWTIAWPIIWVLIGSFTFTGDAPEEVVPYLRGATTISMIVFALMIAGMSNLPGSIAEDRESGMLAKLMSMPINPWHDFAGRGLALIAFSVIAAALVTAVGFAVGARFTGAATDVLRAIGYLVLVIFASAGIGLIVGTLVQHMQGAIMTGVGIAVTTAAVSGVFAPYSILPAPLQAFSRVYPVSSASASAAYSLLGEEVVGYNPLTTTQIGLTIGLSLFLIILGVNLYARFCLRPK